MSRHAFGEIISNIDTFLNNNKQLRDRKGRSLEEWEAYGIVGWDAPLSSYFIQLDNHQDNIPWCISNNIKTFEHLCEIINYIFDVSKGMFDFKNTIRIE